MNRAETEKPALRSKATRMLSFLSKNVKSVCFKNLPFSSGREKKSAGHGHGKAFPCPIMIPAKSKSGRRFDVDQEPTSPKISCMGQIKHKKKSKTAVVPRPTTTTTVQDKTKKKPKAKSTTSSVGGMFSRSKPPRNSDVKSEGGDDRDRAPPGLSQMKKIVSSRDSKLAEFEWKDYSSDEDEVMVPHSAPMLIGGGGGRGGVLLGLEPRNEVNLWKRRTMDPPKPLQLNNTQPS